MNNTVIKVLNREHGAKVIQWWKEQGVDTGSIMGILCEAEKDVNIYYGVIYDKFYSCSYDYAVSHGLSIIELPGEEQPIPNTMTTQEPLKLDDPKYIEEVYSKFPLEQKTKILNNYVEFMMTEYVKLAVRLDLDPEAQITLRDSSTDIKYTFGVTKLEN